MSGENDVQYFDTSTLRAARGQAVSWHESKALSDATQSAEVLAQSGPTLDAHQMKPVSHEGERVKPMAFAAREPLKNLE